MDFEQKPSRYGGKQHQEYIDYSSLGLVDYDCGPCIKLGDKLGKFTVVNIAKIGEDIFFKVQ
jgi:hypothetical protein